MRNIFACVIITLVGCLIISMPAHADKGVVRLTCDQEADVFINGKQKGECGDTSLDLALKGGKYSLVVRKDKKDGSYMYFEKQIFVGEDTAQKLSIQLETRYTEDYYWNKNDYRAVIEHYPKGKYAAEAKRLIEQIEANERARVEAELKASVERARVEAERKARAEEQRQKERKARAEEQRQKEQEAADERRKAEELANTPWVDDSMGLMWARKDNGKLVLWKEAGHYCENFRLGGFTDWRLPTVKELHALKRSGAAEKGIIKLSRRTSVWASDTRGFFKPDVAIFYLFGKGDGDSYTPLRYDHDYLVLPVRSIK